MGDGGPPEETGFLGAGSEGQPKVNSPPNLRVLDVVRLPLASRIRACQSTRWGTLPQLHAARSISTRLSCRATELHHGIDGPGAVRIAEGSEEHTSEPQSLMRNSYSDFLFTK